MTPWDLKTKAMRVELFFKKLFRFEALLGRQSEKLPPGLHLLQWFRRNESINFGGQRLQDYFCGRFEFEPDLEVFTGARNTAIPSYLLNFEQF